MSLTETLLQDTEIEYYFSLLDFAPHFQEHSLNVAKILEYFLTSNDYSLDFIKQTVTAGLLHDVGKFESQDLFLYSGLFTPEQHYSKRLHSRASFDILSDFSDPDIAKIVVQHHEFQENPYPRLSRKLILDDRRDYSIRLLMQGRFLSFADKKEAFVNPRPYKMLKDELLVRKLGKTIKSL